MSTTFDLHAAALAFDASRAKLSELAQSESVGPRILQDGIWSLVETFRLESLRSAEQIALYVNEYAERIDKDFEHEPDYEVGCASVTVFFSVPLNACVDAGHEYKILVHHPQVAERVKTLCLLQPEIEWVSVQARYRKPASRRFSELAAFRKSLENSLVSATENVDGSRDKIASSRKRQFTEMMK